MKLMEGDICDRNYDIICVFLDLKRAFETNQFLNKKKGFGLKDKTFKWFESYLTGRKPRKKTNTSYVVTDASLSVDMAICPRA